MKLREYQKKALEDLTPREQKVIEMRFGLIDDECHTLEEVSQAFGVTRERIRQVEAKALERLRDTISPLLFCWGRQPYRCLCGKYNKKRYKEVICDKCGVKVQPSQDIINKLKE